MVKTLDKDTSRSRHIKPRLRVKKKLKNLTWLYSSSSRYSSSIKGLPSLIWGKWNICFSYLVCGCPSYPNNEFISYDFDFNITRKSVLIDCKYLIMSITYPSLFVQMLLNSLKTHFFQIHTKVKTARPTRVLRNINCQICFGFSYAMWHHSDIYVSTAELI